MNLPALPKDSWLRGIYQFASQHFNELPALIIAQYCRCIRTLYPLYEAQWIDAQDDDGDWHEAIVKSIGNGWVRIHYKGYKRDDVIHSRSRRLATLHAHTNWPNLEAENNSLHQDLFRPAFKLEEDARKWHKGSRMDVQDSLRNWLIGRVREVALKRDGRMVLVHYEGWKKDWDEWINEESYRLLPFRTVRDWILEV